MLYAIIFALLAGYLIFLAVLLGGWGWLLLWPALSFLVLASGYAVFGPGVCGKRPDGRLAWWSLLALLPVLLLLWSLWHLIRLVSWETVANEIAPGVWLGRRAFVHELPPRVVLVVDLTAEFPAPRRIREGRDYLCLPTLDGIAPDELAFRAILAQVADSPGPVYLHCAQGHGRSALLAAALLLQRGLAADVREAERLLRQARPGVRLKPGQRRLLHRLFAEEGRE
jgi:protein-tyrosine phosphatase